MKTTPLKRKAPLKARSQLERKTRLRPISPKRQARSGKAGKLGIVRLYGAAKTALRRRRFEADGYRCQDCGNTVTWDKSESIERFEAEGIWIPYGELSHIVSTGAGGSDTFENTCTRCFPCHTKSHNRGGKPLPAKEREK